MDKLRLFKTKRYNVYLIKILEKKFKRLQFMMKKLKMQLPQNYVFKWYFKIYQKKMGKFWNHETLKKGKLIKYKIKTLKDL